MNNYIFLLFFLWLFSKELLVYDTELVIITSIILLFIFFTYSFSKSFNKFLIDNNYNNKENYKHVGFLAISHFLYLFLMKDFLYLSNLMINWRFINLFESFGQKSLKYVFKNIFIKKIKFIELLLVKKSFLTKNFEIIKFYVINNFFNTFFRNNLIIKNNMKIYLKKKKLNIKKKNKKSW